MSNQKPDIIFFMVDQMGAKWFEAAMNGVCDLPNFHRLQQMGVTFPNAFSNNPVCCPARASIATGMTSTGHGLLSNGYRLNPEIPTFMKTLQMAGWRTGAFGKIHFYPFDSEYYPYPDYREYGWDVVHNTEDNRTGEWLDWIRQNFPEYLDAVLATPAIWTSDLPYYQGHYGNLNVSLSEQMIKAKNDMKWPEGSDGGNHPATLGYFPLPYPEKLCQTNWITEKALTFISETPFDQPIYTHISYVQPHPPFQPPARFLDKVNMEKIPVPVGLGTLFDENTPMGQRWKNYRKAYFADFMHIDEQIGKILDKLEETGRLENAYLIFTSDHGEMLMDHRRMGKSSNHYDPVIRIPLIISGPGIQKNVVCDELVQHEDICPTILDMEKSLLQVHPKKFVRHDRFDPERPLFAGRSLMPFCKGEKQENWRTAAFSESFGALCEGPQRDCITPHPWKKTLRTKDYRYSVSPGRNEGEELYDLKKDPEELINLVHNPEYQEIRLIMQNEMLHRVMLQNYPLPWRDLVVMGAH